MCEAGHGCCHEDTTFVDEDHLLQLRRKEQETRVIVACGGKSSFGYFPEEDLWKRLPDGLKDKSASSKWNCL